jgi:hypothetical protein
MTRCRLGVLGLFPLLLLTQQANAANLLVNGGFESPSQASVPNFATFNVGTQTSTTYITGWTVIQGNVDLTTAADYGPLTNTLDPSSVQDVDLIGNSQGSNNVFGGLAQTFATVAGKTYQLTFDYSHNSGRTSSNGFAAQVTVVDANNLANSLLSTVVSQASGTATWVAFSMDFTATSDSSTLSFVDTLGAFDAGIYLDDVDVEQVNVSATPLPATLPLFAGGLGLVGFLTKRRKSAKQALAA